MKPNVLSHETSPANINFIKQFWFLDSENKDASAETDVIKTLNLLQTDFNLLD